MNDYTITIGGKRWKVRHVRSMKGALGQADLKKKEIRLLKRLRGTEYLEILVHEVLHAANWWLDEEWISNTAGDLSNAIAHEEALKRLGEDPKPEGKA